MSEEVYIALLYAGAALLALAGVALVAFVSSWWFGDGKQGDE